MHVSPKFLVKLVYVIKILILSYYWEDLHTRV